MRRKISLIHILFLCLTLAFTACTKDSDDSRNDGDERSFTSNCGVVFKGNLVNPVKAEEGTPVTINQIIGVDIATVTNDNNGKQMLVKFHGIDADDVSATRQIEARLMLESFGPQAIFYKATDDCETEFGEQTASIGQLFTRETGKNYNEVLLTESYAKANEGDSVCAGEFLEVCYQALEESSSPDQLPENNDFEDFDDDDDQDNQDLLEILQQIENSGGGGAQLNRFLWKPNSESDGRLVILHQHGYGVTAKVIYNNGKSSETGRETGPSNGYDATIRFSKSGCGYGSRIKVKIGKRTYNVENGCNRKEVR